MILMGPFQHEIFYDSLKWDVLHTPAFLPSSAIFTRTFSSSYTLCSWESLLINSSFFILQLYSSGTGQVLIWTKTGVITWLLRPCSVSKAFQRTGVLRFVTAQETCWMTEVKAKRKKLFQTQS